jgi:hypothetical protein
MSTGHEGQHLAIGAALLERGRLVNRVSGAVTVVAITILLVPFWSMSPVRLTTAAGVALAGLAQLYYAVRVAFDEALFRRLAAETGEAAPGLAAFDAAVVELGLMPDGLTARPAAARVAGALRLLKLQALWLALQAIVAILGTVVHAAAR